MDPVFSNEAKDVLAVSRRVALHYKHDNVILEHFILGVLQVHSSTAYEIISLFTNAPEEIKKKVVLVLMQHSDEPEQNSHSPETNALPSSDSTYIKRGWDRVRKLSYLEARLLKSDVVGTEHILLSLLRDGEAGITGLLGQFNISYHRVRNLLAERLNQPDLVMEEDPDEFPQDPRKDPLMDNFGGEFPEEQEGAQQAVLKHFGTDFTQLARLGRLDPVIGRGKEIERVIQILSKRKKNNVLLIGDPGVGKTAIAEGIALRIANKEVTSSLLDKRVINLDLASLVAGTKYRGQFEERTKALLKEIEKSPDVILFIDEMHTMVSAGGGNESLNVSNMFKPALARGEMQCIGATTLDEYRKYIEKEGALARRFQNITIQPTSIDESIAILEQSKSYYEKHHEVVYTSEAIRACVELSERYISGRLLPDKAIDVMDEAGATIHLLSQHGTGENAVESGSKKSKKPAKVELKDIAKVIALITQIPLAKILQQKTDRLVEMEAALKREIIGQEHAIQKVVNAIKRTQMGLKKPNQPAGAFLFVGPTGVGKTALAKTIAHYFYEHKQSFVRIDMSEYSEQFAISRLIGAPPGYVGYDEGGQLTEKVRRNPYSLVLLDEIDKAHPSIYNLLLQIMEDGVLTDSLNRKIDFRNTLIIMTSNVGMQNLDIFGGGIGFKSAGELNNSFALLEASAKKAIKKRFAPEFLNRLTDVVIFDVLHQEALFKILDIHVNSLQERLKAIGYDLSLSEATKQYLVSKGYNKEYGVRSLQRALQKYIEEPVVQQIIDNQFKTNSTIIVAYHATKDRLTFSAKANIKRTRARKKPVVKKPATALKEV